MEYSSYNVNTPQWREITVGSHLPAELRKLAEIAHNLWWTWNDDVKKLYCDLDPGLWKEVEQNPVLFLERINYEKLVALAHDENFVYKMDAVYSAFKKYVDVEPDHQRPSIAYFSMGTIRRILHPQLRLSKRLSIRGSIPRISMSRVGLQRPRRVCRCAISKWVLRLLREMISTRRSRILPSRPIRRLFTVSCSRSVCRIC